ncbi:MAG: pur operon repressor [Clostridia bacterium]|nr:pur operon repressor [Clostridia bacterium]
MKRIHRVSAIIKILSDSPNKVFSLKQFCESFDAAKSSISEDLQAAKEVLEQLKLGIIETMPGAAGGVKFIPYISDEAIRELQSELCERLSDSSRILGGGFLYTSDLMFDSALVKRVATVFARKFQNCGADYVTTIETKGIPVASMTAYMLNLPLVVIRRETKVSEGSTVSINYFSGSYDRVQKMSIAKRAVTPKSKAIIIDDFMRAGGSLKGISEILSEFEIEVVGTGVVIAAVEPEIKKLESYCPLLYLGKVNETEKTINVFANESIF